jgi:hypothetical protein
MKSRLKTLTPTTRLKTRRPTTRMRVQVGETKIDFTSFGDTKTRLERMSNTIKGKPSMSSLMHQALVEFLDKYGF